MHDERALGPLRCGADAGVYEYQLSSSRLALLDSPAQFYTDWHQPETQLVNLLGYVPPGRPQRPVRQLQSAPSWVEAC